jgi:sugar O-acyltransferase (sialic acid O-acetyltransferase NeuD family)
MDIVIIGTGGMAKEIWGLCRRMEYNILGFIAERAGGIDTFMGLPILAHDTEFIQQGRQACVIANGSPATRQKIAGSYLGSAHYWPNVIHPKTEIMGELDLGDGGITIMPGGVIMPDVYINNFTAINMGVTIGHDVSIGTYCVVNHNAAISGNVTIGPRCLIGAGATIIEGNTIGAGVTIGAGAVVTKDIPAGETWVGVPARRLAKGVETPTYAELYKVQ